MGNPIYYLIKCNINQIFKYFLIYYKVNGTTVLRIKQESLEIIK